VLRKRRQSASVCEAKTSRAACSAVSVTCARTWLSPAPVPSSCRLRSPLPSRQPITSSRRIWSGRRASSCPPCGPRVELTSPARRSVIKTWSKNGPGIPCRRAISPLCRAPRPVLAASSRAARTPYSVFIENRIRIGVLAKVDRTGQVYRRAARGRLALRDAEGQREEQRPQHDQRHGGRDQAKAAQTDGAPVLAR